VGVKESGERKRSSKMWGKESKRKRGVLLGSDNFGF
jgi:hypothetical protein